MCAQDVSSGMQTLDHGTCVDSLVLGGTKTAELLARVFQDKFHQQDCPEKLCAQDLNNLSKVPNSGPWYMHIYAYTASLESGWNRFLDKFHQSDCLEIDGIETSADGTCTASGSVHELTSTEFFRHAKKRGLLSAVLLLGSLAHLVCFGAEIRFWSCQFCVKLFCVKGPLSV